MFPIDRAFMVAQITSGMIAAGYGKTESRLPDLTGTKATNLNLDAILPIAEQITDIIIARTVNKPVNPQESKQ